MHFQLLPALAVEVSVPDEAVVSVVPLATSVLPDVLSSAEAVSAVFCVSVVPASGVGVAVSDDGA